MNDPIVAEPSAEAIYSDALRMLPVVGDGMEPRLRGGRDFVLVKPIDHFVGEGTYVYDEGFGPRLINVQNMIRELRLFPENKVYSETRCSRAEFEKAVVAFVVGDIKVRDTRFLRR